MPDGQAGRVYFGSVMSGAACRDPHPFSLSFHIPRLSCMHLLNLQLNILTHIYIDKLFNSLLVLQSEGPHPYLDILFFSFSFYSVAMLAGRMHHTTLLSLNPTTLFFISFFLSLFLSPSLPFYTVGFISLMWAVFTPCLGLEEELIYGSL